MKTIKRTTEVEIEMFVADDGSEHTTADECEKHEKFSRHLELQKLQLPCKCTPFDGGEHYDDCNYYWYKVTSDDELELINTVFDINERATDYPSYICIETRDEILPEEIPEGDFYVTNLRKCIKHVELVTSQLGCGITFPNKSIESIINDYEANLKSQIKSVRYRVNEETAKHELYGFMTALKVLGLIESEDCYVTPKHFEDIQTSNKEG